MVVFDGPLTAHTNYITHCRKGCQHPQQSRIIIACAVSTKTGEMHHDITEGMSKEYSICITLLRYQETRPTVNTVLLAT